MILASSCRGLTSAADSQGEWQFRSHGFVLAGWKIGRKYWVGDGSAAGMVSMGCVKHPRDLAVAALYFRLCQHFVPSVVFADSVTFEPE